MLSCRVPSCFCFVNLPKFVFWGFGLAASRRRLVSAHAWRRAVYLDGGSAIFCGDSNQSHYFSGAISLKAELVDRQLQAVTSHWGLLEECQPPRAPVVRGTKSHHDSSGRNAANHVHGQRLWRFNHGVSQTLRQHLGQPTVHLEAMGRGGVRLEVNWK